MRKTALVTGGARGIGRAIVADLSQDHDLAFTWHSTEPEPAPDLLAIRADLTEDGAAERIVAQIIDRFGQLDLIVNNAAEIQPTPHDAFDAAAHARHYALNVTAPAALLAAALPHLQPGAAVVSISSVNAVLPPMGAVAYGASKAALNTWTRGMAKELGPRGIRINAVAPGAINLPEAPRPDDLTEKFVDMTALGRIGTPGDIAPAVRFLASDAARFITGEVLTVSGGYRL
ncbi:SDR family NAD(P)-dependent oxidoreductase [Chachezhania antarctica]|uniref:SDR family NAD(P)-dependent oxidoreductase n=1 Tax=Chachezhania antarctica TaxID=2340860 RepID=UPI000EAEC322|nr:SDR family oxidoreductase [Chachezhania antarctica]|tara:strand:- start:5265 stop:5957 length:693 start_codon:yes stop_codon:yes gene_type:complete